MNRLIIRRSRIVRQTLCSRPIGAKDAALVSTQEAEFQLFFAPRIRQRAQSGRQDHRDDEQSSFDHGFHLGV
jgi:hypothetical protein